MTRKIQEELKIYKKNSINELLKMISEKTKEQSRLKRELLFGKISNYGDLRKIKLQIARINTVISEKIESEIKEKENEKNQ